MSEEKNETTEAGQSQEPEKRDEAPVTLTDEEIQKRRDLVIEVLRHIYDPEIPINLYDLGLIYDVQVKESGAIHIVMTLTSPNCPEAEVLPSTVQLHVRSVTRTKDVTVDVVWDPPWSWERMSEAARLEFGF